METTASQAEEDTKVPDPDADDYSGPPEHRPIYRPTHDRMLAGVASGLARYLGIDVLLVRIALIVLCFVGGIGLPLYLASWVLIPEEDTKQSIAGDFVHSMQGWRD